MEINWNEQFKKMAHDFVTQLTIWMAVIATLYIIAAFAK